MASERHRWLLSKATVSHVAFTCRLDTLFDLASINSNAGSCMTHRCYCRAHACNLSLEHAMFSHVSGLTFALFRFGPGFSYFLNCFFMTLDAACRHGNAQGAAAPQPAGHDGEPAGSHVAAAAAAAAVERHAAPRRLPRYLRPQQPVHRLLQADLRLCAGETRRCKTGCDKSGAFCTTLNATELLTISHTSVPRSRTQRHARMHAGQPAASIACGPQRLNRTYCHCMSVSC